MNRASSGAALAVALVLAAVSAEVLPADAGVRGAPPTARPKIATPAALVQEYLAAWNRHDAAAVLALFDAQPGYLDAASLSRASGIAAIERLVQARLAAVPDLAWRTTAAPIAGAGGVTFEWVLSGTLGGGWVAGAKGTGKPFELRGVTVLRLHDYRIVSASDYYDPRVVVH